MERVQRVLQSGRLALGPSCDEFEDRMAALCDARFAVAVSSGTAALHLITRALGIGPDHEVITTPYSFVASSNAALFENAKPVFVDIDPSTLNINPDLIERRITPKTRAILAVDVFGLPANWPALREIAERHGLALIDDGCEALGAHIEGRPIGSWGDATAFGFYPNKQITTGEGGCVTTNDPDVAELVRSMRNQGRASSAVMRHVRLGYNYRLDEMSAAMGCAQLERFAELQTRRAAVASAYTERLAELAGDVILPPVCEIGARSWLAYVVRLGDHFPDDARDRLRKILGRHGIESSPYFPTIHEQPFYCEMGFTTGAFPNAERISRRTLALPFFTQITDEQVERVTNAIGVAIRELPQVSERAVAV
ncbi:MAG: DegT/DnrJ/EryC1/StrS family aminotransferase [Rhodothermia bacterium]|nr:DegT/DnrJ/EryC1/StrS family aminotransferase [Rhodothermia bacterium]